MVQKIRLGVQLLFLAIFIVLMITGKAQIWMGLILLSVILAAFFGRFYCGWMCPMNTLIRPTKWISKKLNFTKKEVPKIFKTKVPKYFAFGIFLIGLGYTIYTITQGRKFPLPLIIIPIAIIVTFFINENTWHRYLCPWGTLFSFTGRFSKYIIKSSNQCTSCSICAKSCPVDAIVVDKEKGAVSDPTNCLLCFECTEKCPTSVIGLNKKEKALV